MSPLAGAISFFPSVTIDSAGRRASSWPSCRLRGVITIAFPRRRLHGRHCRYVNSFSTNWRVRTSYDLISCTHVVRYMQTNIYQKRTKTEYITSKLTIDSLRELLMIVRNCGAYLCHNSFEYFFLLSSSYHLTDVINCLQRRMITHLAASLLLTKVIKFCSLNCEY